MTILNINDVKIRWLGHASFMFSYNNFNIYIDPYKIETQEKADLILITHAHYDHCSVSDIAKLVKPETMIITTPDTVSKIANATQSGNIKTVEPNEKFKYHSVEIQTLPAYNTNKEFHPKENAWVGYIITINGLKIYHSGDTDLIPEMNNVKADIVLLPVGGTYTMDAAEAAKAVDIIKPKIAVPMHWGSIVGKKTDAEKFKSMVKCEVRIL